MIEISRRIAECAATNEDYGFVMKSLGYEVRPHNRMFRRLQMRKRGTLSWVSVPDMTDAKDAAMYLTPERANGRFVDISQSRDAWTARWQGYGVGDDVAMASSSFLGAAMWAAYARSI